MTVYARDVEAAEDALREAREAYLRRFGWTYTCNFPGSFWVWRRDFVDLDQSRRKWWEEACAQNPPLGPPSEPTAYGIVHASFDQALAITLGTLDERDEDVTCEACDEKLKDDDLVLRSVDGGLLHRDCCGPEREGFVDANDEPLAPDAPLPTGWRWGDRAKSEIAL